MKKNIILASMLATSIASTQALAFERPNVSIGPTFGTTGLGGDISLRFNDKWGLNIGHQEFEYDTTYEDTDLDYDAELGLKTTSLTAEFYPTGNKFFIAAGLANPDNYLDIDAIPNNSQYEFNGNVYDATDVGSISGQVDLGNDLTPYLGIGFKSNKEKGFGYFSEIGVYKMDSDASLSATYNDAVDPSIRSQLDNELAIEENKLEDSLNDFGLYPVFKAGIMYTF